MSITRLSHISTRDVVGLAFQRNAAGQACLARDTSEGEEISGNYWIFCFILTFFSAVWIVLLVRIISANKLRFSVCLLRPGDFLTIIYYFTG